MMRLSALVLLVPCLLLACGAQGSVNGDEDGTSSTLDGTSTSSDTQTTAPPTDGSDTTATGSGPDSTSSGSTDGTTTSEPVDPCPGVPTPEPPFDYDEGLVERIDADRIAVDLAEEQEETGETVYRWVFELGPDEQAPGTYTVPVERRCVQDCPNPDHTEEVVIEVVSLDDCLAAAFLEAPESNCNEFFQGCGGFVEPVL